MKDISSPSPRASAKKERKKKRAITDQERADLAIMRFTIDPATKTFVSLSELSRKTGREQAVLSKAILAAFQNDLVSIERRRLPLR